MDLCGVLGLRCDRGDCAWREAGRLPCALSRVTGLEKRPPSMLFNLEGVLGVSRARRAVRRPVRLV